MTPWVEALDGSVGRPPFSKIYSDGGWQQRWDWAIVLESWYPPKSRLIVHHNQRDGTTTLSIEGMDMNQEDGA